VPTLPAVVDREAAMRAVRADLGDCTRCGLCRGRKNIVFGVGNVSTRLMFVGEGPGRDEDAQGEPFVGAAGQLLNRMIDAMTLSRERVYIANVIKCRPPDNRDPEPDEVASCLPFLVRQIEVIRPEVIVTLGRHSFHALSGSKAGVGASRGRFFDYRGIPVMPTFHPAYVLRKEGEELREARKLVWDDLQAVMKRLGLEPARRTS
jgi:DNA polymerase